jgi:hypothetical protein
LYTSPSKTRLAGLALAEGAELLLEVALDLGEDSSATVSLFLRVFLTTGFLIDFSVSFTMVSSDDDSTLIKTIQQER